MLMFALLVQGYLKLMLQAITWTQMEQKEIPTCAEFPNFTRLGGHLFLTLFKEGVQAFFKGGYARGGCSSLVCTAVGFSVSWEVEALFLLRLTFRPPFATSATSHWHGTRNLMAFLRLLSTTSGWKRCCVRVCPRGAVTEQMFAPCSASCIRQVCCLGRY